WPAAGGPGDNSRVTGPPPLDLAALVRDGRQRAGLSQEALAARSGVAVRAISDLERGRSRGPPAATVEHLPRAAGLTGEQRRELMEAATATDREDAAVDRTPENAAGGPRPDDEPDDRPVSLLPPEVGMIGRAGVVDELRRRLTGPGAPV